MKTILVLLKNKLKKYQYYFIQFWKNKGHFLLAHTYRRRTFFKEVLLLKNKQMLDYSTLPYPVPWQSIKKHQNLRVEIGTGHGENLLKTARDYPQDLVIGTEIASRFARMTAQKTSKLPAKNVKVLHADGYQVLKNLFADGSITQINILFPDPWHKKRHHKRRPLTAEFFRWAVEKLVQRRSHIQPYIFIATDWTEYYEFIIAELEKVSNIIKYTTDCNYCPADWQMAETHYYKKWKKEGRQFYWIKLEKHK